MGWHELPLIIFTVLAQCATGAYWLCALTVLVGKAGNRNLALEKAMIVIWLFLGVGFVASAFHLGSPLRAFNTLSKVASVPMSQEALFGMLFMVCGGLAWLFSLTNKAAGARKGLYVIGLIMSLLFICAMTRIYYQMPTVLTWHYWTTPVSFAATALIGGAVLTNLILKLAQVNADKSPCAGRAAMVIAFLALILAIVSAVGLASLLPQVSSSIQSAGNLVPDMERLQTWRFIALVLGVGVVICQQGRRSNAVSLALIGVCLVVAGEIIGRGIFYGLHMSPGLV